MAEYRLAEGEARFADIIWERAPIGSTELVRLCEQRLGWKKSTTYTVLKKLCDRGIFQNRDAVVSALLSREEFYGEKSRKFVEENNKETLAQVFTDIRYTREANEHFSRLYFDFISDAGFPFPD